jgi:hypothetical protein
MADQAPVNPQLLDLRAITETLRGGKATEGWVASWLPVSHGDPEAFTEVMYAYAGARRGSIFKSRPRDGYDLYHDAVTALLGRRRTALLGREGEGWTSVSFESLHARCNALAAAWLDEDAAPGQSVAVVASPGIDQAVGLLTAFRLGMLPTLIPPLGPAFVRDALARCEAERVATAGRHRMLVGAQKEALPITAGARGTGPTGSFTYPAGKPAARLLTPFGTAENGVVEVTARTLLDGAVRDALFAYTLDAQDTLAAPGFDPVQHEPALLLAPLVVGATRAYLDERDLASEPELLGQLGVTTLGLHRSVRDRWTSEQRRLPPAVRLWFRSLTDVVDGDRWDAFWKAIPTPKQPGCSVVSGAAAGGVGLFSAPSTAAPSTRVWPAPGISWTLGELGASQVGALNDTGVFLIRRGEEADPAFLQAVIGRWGEGFVYGGSLDVGPDAHPYPCALAEQAVGGLPAVKHAAAFPAPGRWLNESRVVLLVFVEGRRPGEQPPVTLPEIEKLLRRELGPRLLPDRIEVLPLRPRLLDGVVDRAWCRSQYLTGSLHRKARSEVFLLLGRLGYIFAKGAQEDV